VASGIVVVARIRGRDDDDAHSTRGGSRPSRAKRCLAG
jgi:hypothetical protein